MKKIILGAFVLLLTTHVSAQEINWVTFEEAAELQKKDPKKIMMDVYTNWCGPCKMLDRNTFKNKDVVDYVNENYYAVKFNGEGNAEVKYMDKTFGNPRYDPAKANRRNSSHEFANFLQIRAYPTIAFFDEDLKMITPVTGYKTPQQLELYLKLFKGEKYKEITTQEAFNEYYKSFVPVFGTKKDVVKADVPKVEVPQVEDTVTEKVEVTANPLQTVKTDVEEVKAIQKFKTYIIQDDDSLSKIAKNFYGDHKLYDLIYQANLDVLKSPKLIYVGQKIKIPILN